MQSLRIGNVRSGSLVGSVPLPAVKDASFHIEVQGQDSGEVHIPFAALTAAQNANISDLYLPDPGSLPSRYVILEDDTNDFLWAFPIGKIDSSRTEGEKAEHVLGLTSLYKGILANIPAIPSSKRAAINDSTATWKKTNSSYAGLYGSFGVDSCNETGDGLKFPQSILWTTGDGSATDVTNTVTVSEMPSITDLFDNLAGSYPNIETVFRGEYTDSSKTAIQWRQVSGTTASPHYQKDTNLGTYNLDDPASTVKSIEVSNDGMNQSPSWFAGQSQSYDTTKGKENWIDLTSKWATAPSGNTRYMHKFSKESFDSYLSAAELEAQENARVSDSSTYRKTYTIKVWGWNWLNALGKTLTVQSSQKWGGLNEQLRITAIDWTINDPSSIELTVMPKDLARFPRVPRHTADRTQDALDKNKKGSAFKKTPLSSLGGVGGLGTSGGLGGTGGSGTTITTPTIPAGWTGDYGTVNPVSSQGSTAISAPIGAMSATRYNGLIFIPANDGYTIPTPNLGASFPNTPIRSLSLGGTGTVAASTNPTGSIPGTLLNSLRNSVPDASYGGASRQQETIEFRTWAANGYYYVHMTLIVSFGPAQSLSSSASIAWGQPRQAEKFATSVAYTTISSTGAIGTTWNTTSGPVDPTTGNPVQPTSFAIYNFGQNLDRVAFLGGLELVAWSGAAHGVNAPHPTLLSMYNNYSAGGPGTGWASFTPPSFSPDPHVSSVPLTLYGTYVHTDGYVYAVTSPAWFNPESYMTSTPAVYPRIHLLRMDATTNIPGSWTQLFSYAIPAYTSVGKLVQPQLAAIKNTLVIQAGQSSNGSSSSRFLYVDTTNPTKFTTYDLSPTDGGASNPFGTGTGMNLYMGATYTYFNYFDSKQYNSSALDVNTMTPATANTVGHRTLSGTNTAPDSTTTTVFVAGPQQASKWFAAGTTLYCFMSHSNNDRLGTTYNKLYFITLSV